jgi:hypothetical protein
MSALPNIVQNCWQSWVLNNQHKDSARGVSNFVDLPKDLTMKITEITEKTS